MARPDLAGNSALATPAGRVDRIDDVDAAVTAWTAARTTDEVFSSLQQADVPAAPVRSLPEVINDPAPGQGNARRDRFRRPEMHDPR